MRYRVVAVGKLKEAFYRDGCRHFLARLSHLAACEVVEVKDARARSAVESRELEGRALLAQVHGRGVVLDERGSAFTTAALADHLSRLEGRGVSMLTLLIGGAEGHGEALRGAVDEAWSLSPLTLPHDLARLVLLEQLYRAETVRAGHPYHRD